MDKMKTLPIALASIILAAFLTVSFLIFDASSQVYIAGIKDSYAENYAKVHGVKFIEIYDSDNPEVEIPKIKEETDKKNEDVKEENEKKEDSVPTEKDNSEFGYNYEGNAVNIMMYKGSDPIVIIPDTIDDLPVTKLSLNVLNRGILAVYIPQSVTEIDTEFTTPRYTSGFFTIVLTMLLGYIFAIASTFLGLKKSRSSEGTFYGIPFVYSGLVTFIAITVWCGAALLFGFSPLLQVIVAAIIFACALGKLLKKSVARELVDTRGKQVRQQTQFIKLITSDADTLLARAKTDETKALVKKVYEALRYSDPMSTPELVAIESQIQERYIEFEGMIIKSDVENAKIVCDELLGLIDMRNNKCKVLK